MDRRADIWAFGAVLYERLSGCRAFAGEDVSLTLSAALQREPVWNSLPSQLSIGLGIYLRRCLEKDPRQRVQAVGDVRLALDGAFEPVPGDVSPDAAKGSAPWRSALIAVAAALVGSIVTGLIVRNMPRGWTDGVARMSITLPDTSGLYDIRGALALSPDGRDVAYATPDGAMFHRPLDQQEPIEILSGQRVSTPFFSPMDNGSAFFQRRPLNSRSSH